MHPQPLIHSTGRSRLRRSALAVTAAMLLVACGSDAASDAQPADAPAADADTAEGDTGSTVSPLLNGVVPTVNGSQVDLASFAGQDVLVWVWAPW